MAFSKCINTCFLLGVIFSKTPKEVLQRKMSNPRDLNAILNSTKGVPVPLHLPISCVNLTRLPLDGNVIKIKCLSLAWETPKQYCQAKGGAAAANCFLVELGAENEKLFFLHREREEFSICYNSDRFMTEHNSPSNCNQ